MEEFKGTPGNWDIDTEGKTILSDAGFIIASIDLVHGVDADGEMMAASKQMFEVLQEFSRQYGRLWDTVNPVGGGFLTPESVAEYDRIHQLATAAIAKALGKE